MEECRVPDLEVREWIAYGLLAVLFLSAGGWGVKAKRQHRIRKLRLAGNGAVKRAELQRRG
jgi:hypothetical protein